jgi:hypothetical protein
VIFSCGATDRGLGQLIVVLGSGRRSPLGAGAESFDKLLRKRKLLKITLKWRRFAPLKDSVLFLSDALVG